MSETRVEWAVSCECGAGTLHEIVGVDHGAEDVARDRVHSLRRNGHPAQVLRREVRVGDWQEAAS